MTMPELYLPDSKPTGEVKIDWEHPETEGLTLYVIFQKGRYIDLVSGKEIFISSSDIPQDDGAAFNGVDAYLTIPGVELDSAYSLTMHNASLSNAGSNLGYFISYSGVGVSNSLNGFIAGDSAGSVAGEVKFFGDNSNDTLSLLSGMTYSALNDKAISVAVDGLNGEMYIAGEPVASNATFGTVPMANGTKNTLYIGGRTDLNGARFWAGLMKYLIIHNQKLSIERINTLNNDYRQFLVPA